MPHIPPNAITPTKRQWITPVMQAVKVTEVTRAGDGNFALDIYNFQS